jgi:hypothetical protein
MTVPGLPVDVLLYVVDEFLGGRGGNAAARALAATSRALRRLLRWRHVVLRSDEGARRLEASVGAAAPTMVSLACRIVRPFSVYDAHLLLGGACVDRLRCLPSFCVSGGTPRDFRSTAWGTDPQTHARIPSCF